MVVDSPTIALPTFSHTPLDDIPKTVARVRQTFFSQKTRPVSFRLTQLRRLYWALVDHEAEILEACRLDLGKGVFDGQVSELMWLQNDIIFMCENLEKWMKDEKADNMSLSNKLLSPRIRKDPFGVVLVIGAFNFPFNLALGPMIGAISGGNTVILKPSEQSSNCAAVMQKVVEAALDPSCYAIVQGGIPETQALLTEKWDKIFFTGSERTGKIVAKAGAATLTPVVLELGGRNPAIITKSANIRLAARRLLWSKTMNVGQVCISQNYILADADVVDTLIAELRVALAEFYPKGTKSNPDYGHIVNISSFNRIKSMLDNSNGKIVIGGAMDASQLYIEPTVVLVSSESDSLLTSESFGPLIPILPVPSLTEALRIANTIHATPLGVYAFGSSAENQQILNSIRSGGASLNDGFFHGVIPTLEFGGVGDSGSGSYRGKASFDTFVHRRAITTTPGWMEKLLAVRYPPYAGTGKLAQFVKMSKLKPNFDREGKVNTGILGYIFSVGGLMKAAAVAVLAVVIKLVVERKGGGGRG